MKKLLIISAALIAVFCPFLYGQEVTGLRTAIVQVEDSSAQARDKAIYQGLAEVLVKMTGHRGVLRRPAIRQLLNNAPRYVLEYGYVSVPGIPKNEPDSTDLTTTALSVQFDGAEINRVLRAEKLPIWPANRPRLMVWLLRSSEAGEAAFVQRDGNTQSYYHLDSVFDRRGVPVMYPLLDLEDQLSLAADVAWHFDTSAIARASARYAADSWLVLRVYQSADGHWRGASVISLGDDTVLTEAGGETLEALITDAVDQALDRFSQSFTYVAQNLADKVSIAVDRVTAFNDYMDLMTLLKNFSMIREVSVVAVTENQVRLDLTIEGDRRQLFDALYRYKNLLPGGVETTSQYGVRVEQLHWVSGY